MTGGDITGAIVLSATLVDGRFARVSLTSTRNVAAGRALIGRTPAEALRLVPLIFPLCGMAQTAAALDAVEKAAGIEVSPDQKIARQLIVAAERAVNLAWRLVLDWAPLAGAQPQTRIVAEVRRIASAFPAALGISGAWAVPGGVPLKPDRAALSDLARALDRFVATLFPEAADPAHTPETLRATLSHRGSIPARLVAEALTFEAGFGAHDVAVLGMPKADWFGERLASNPHFAARPTRDGKPAETGPLAQAAHPQVAAVARAWGAGLAARLFADAFDAITLPQHVHALTRWIEPDPTPAVAGMADGAGTGLAITTRGPLAHRIELCDGRIAAHAAVAPTEWNFHPDGPFVSALRAAPIHADPARAAALMAASFDACVPVRLDLVHRPTREMAHA
jgi:coenzyme F420-reducing hydrogenase alpha subunit